MKYKKIIISLFLFIFLIPWVKAKEVKAKYRYVNDESVYSQKLSIDKNNINFGDLNCTIVNKKNQDVSVKIIEVTNDDEISWLNKIIKNKNIKAAYYFMFEDNNNNTIDINDIKIKLNDNINNTIVYSVNGSGKIIDQNNSSEIKINNNSYFVISSDNNYKEIKINMTDGGIVVLDGKIISQNDNYKFSSDTIIIRPESDYAISKVILNDKDVTDSINNGFLDITNLNKINLDITFVGTISEENTEYHNFTGQVIYNGKPLANAYIELHSNKMTTITDENGYFTFNNVSLGKHSITILDNNKVIGYSEFNIQKKMTIN